MSMPLKLGCLLMAAGNAARFGQNKLLADLDGKPLIRLALDVIPAPLFSAVTVVTQYDEVAALAAQYGFSVLRNDRPELGISHTIRLGTAAMSECDGILYLPADQPLLRRQTVERMINCFLKNSNCIVGAACGGRRGSPNLFPADLFPELLALTGDRGGSSIIQKNISRYLPIDAAACELADCDTPQGLAMLKTVE